MKKNLINKVIVISGGPKGVGKTMAEECALRGASIVIGGHDEMGAKNSLNLYVHFVYNMICGMKKHENIN